MANLINGYELLPGADLTGAFLAGIIFSGNLSGANLSGALLYSSILDRVNLEGANLEGANLEGSYLQGANLQGVNLQGANLQNVSLQGANLRGANLTNANLRGAHLNNINLQDAILNGANLEGAHFVMNDLRGANLENIGHLPLVQVQPPRVQPAIEGVAFESHNYFDTLNIDEITRFLQEFNIGHADFNPKTISGSASENSEQSLFTPLLIFINNSDLFRPDEKESNKQKLNRVLTRLTHYSRFELNRELLNSIIEFVSKQSDDFIEQYIRIISDECLNAYGKGEGNESCVKGVFERIITVLGSAASNLLTHSINQDNETYKRLKQIFHQIDFGESVQEWATTYLEDGEKEEELRSLSIEERKAHFINFMITKYEGLINPTIRRKIREEAEQYQQFGVFERMAMGRSKKTRRTKKSRRTKKTKKTRRTKKTKKIINKYSKKKQRQNKL